MKNPILATAIDGAVEESLIPTLTTGSQSVSLYFHIPFCTKKCHYCHFYVLPDLPELKTKLMRGFEQEWAMRLPMLQGKEIVSIYFGGGTPSLFGPERIAQILEWIRCSFSTHDTIPIPEVTLEANPEEVTEDLLRNYAQAGINRLSMGIQSLHDPLLITLGRIHNRSKALDAVEVALKAGLRNISIDLMYDLPKQTLPIWEQTLDCVCELPIQHLSLYNLTIEPHTLFFKKREALKPLLPNDEESLAMYQRAREKLEAVGLQQYEISAFCRKDRWSRHNVGYWIGRPFLGFGPSAFSYWNGSRFQNICHLNHYCSMLDNDQLPVDFTETLGAEDRCGELLAIHLRILNGVDLKHFQQLHGSFSRERKRTLDRLIQEGWLDYHNDRIKLSSRGILFYDTIASEII